jgi:hypothetical protein
MNISPDECKKLRNECLFPTEKYDLCVFPNKNSRHALPVLVRAYARSIIQQALFKP